MNACRRNLTVIAASCIALASTPAFAGLLQVRDLAPRDTSYSTTLLFERFDRASATETLASVVVRLFGSVDGDAFFTNTLADPVTATTTIEAEMVAVVDGTILAEVHPSVSVSERVEGGGQRSYAHLTANALREVVLTGSQMGMFLTFPGSSQVAMSLRVSDRSSVRPDRVLSAVDITRMAARVEVEYVTTPTGVGSGSTGGGTGAGSVPEPGATALLVAACLPARWLLRRRRHQAPSRLAWTSLLHRTP